MAETVSAKALETEAVVRQRQKQRECLHSRYVGGGQWNQEVATAAKKAPVAAATAAKGIGAVVLEAATVAMVFADSSGNGGAGNDVRNRGSGSAIARNQNMAAVESKTLVVAVAMDVAASAASAVAAAVAAVKWQGQILAWLPWTEVTPPNSS